MVLTWTFTTRWKNERTQPMTETTEIETETETPIETKPDDEGVEIGARSVQVSARPQSVSLRTHEDIERFRRMLLDAASGGSEEKPGSPGHYIVTVLSAVPELLSIASEHVALRARFAREIALDEKIAAAKEKLRAKKAAEKQKKLKELSARASRLM